LQSISGSIEGSVPQKAAGWQARLPIFELALVLVRLNHLARLIVNADHSIMGAAAAFIPVAGEQSGLLTASATENGLLCTRMKS
jgi:hypothetical protein